METAITLIGQVHVFISMGGGRRLNFSDLVAGRGYPQPANLTRSPVAGHPPHQQGDDARSSPSLAQPGEQRQYSRTLLEDTPKLTVLFRTPEQTSRTVVSRKYAPPQRPPPPPPFATLASVQSMGCDIFSCNYALSSSALPTTSCPDRKRQRI